jgi:hypothetical protein
MKILRSFMDCVQARVVYLADARYLWQVRDSELPGGAGPVIARPEKDRAPAGNFAPAAV